MWMMPKIKEICSKCGKDFETYRSPNQPKPKFCSYECYWASGEPAKNTPNWRSKKEKGEKPGRKRVYIGRADGKPKYMPRSHYVWNSYHPDNVIEPGEYIHHIDGNKSKDDPANLQKMAISDHQSYHANNISSEERSRRMRAYHTAHPGCQRKGQTKICPICGKEFYRPPSAKAITCSYKCMGKYMTMVKK
jgi:hypothetical protein